MGKKLNRDKHAFVRPAKLELHNDIEYFNRAKKLYKEYKDFKGGNRYKRVSRPLLEKISNFIKDAYNKYFNYYPCRNQEQILQAWNSVRKELDKMEIEGTKPTPSLVEVKSLFEISDKPDISQKADAPFPVLNDQEAELVEKELEKRENEEFKLQQFSAGLKTMSTAYLKKLLEERKNVK